MWLSGRVLAYIFKKIKIHPKEGECESVFLCGDFCVFLEMTRPPSSFCVLELFSPRTSRYLFPSSGLFLCTHLASWNSVFLVFERLGVYMASGLLP